MVWGKAIAFRLRSQFGKNCNMESKVERIEMATSMSPVLTDFVQESAKRANITQGV